MLDFNLLYKVSRRCPPYQQVIAYLRNDSDSARLMLLSFDIYLLNRMR